MPSSNIFNAKVVAAQAQHQPVISVDTKKKDLIGNFKNGGTDYRPKRDPQRVNVHDFEDKKLGKVVPYGAFSTARTTEVGRKRQDRRDHRRLGQLWVRGGGASALASENLKPGAS
jgi:hypothetical protein